MEKTKRLILFGDSAFAEIAYEYFTYDSEYQVETFCLEQAYIKSYTMCGLPMVPFETVETQYNPADFHFYIATAYTQMNELRKRLYLEAKAKGYGPASYVSSRAFVWRNCQIGEHCFIFEDNTVQPFVTIGDNVIMWSGNHIGHHSTIHSHCFLSSHVVVSGFVNMGEACFMGVNATIANNVNIGNNCLTGAGALILADVPDDQKVVGIWKKQKSDT